MKERDRRELLCAKSVGAFAVRIEPGCEFCESGGGREFVWKLSSLALRDAV